MSRIDTTSSSPAGPEHLLRVPLEQLHNHPFNPNEMNELALAQLLPADATALSETLAALTMAEGKLLADLMAASNQLHARRPRYLSFSLSAEDEVDVEKAIAAAVAAVGLKGADLRGHALGLIARAHLGGKANG